MKSKWKRALIRNVSCYNFQGFKDARRPDFEGLHVMGAHCPAQGGQKGEGSSSPLALGLQTPGVLCWGRAHWRRPCAPVWITYLLNFRTKHVFYLTNRTPAFLSPHFSSSDWLLSCHPGEGDGGRGDGERGPAERNRLQTSESAPATWRGGARRPRPGRKPFGPPISEPCLPSEF